MRVPFGAGSGAGSTDTAAIPMPRLRESDGALASIASCDVRAIVPIDVALAINFTRPGSLTSDRRANAHSPLVVTRDAWATGVVSVVLRTVHGKPSERATVSSRT